MVTTKYSGPASNDLISSLLRVQLEPVLYQFFSGGRYTEIIKDFPQEVDTPVLVRQLGDHSPFTVTGHLTMRTAVQTWTLINQSDRMHLLNIFFHELNKVNVGSTNLPALQIFCRFFQQDLLPILSLQLN